MPDYAENFQPKNKADACCDFCCVPCSDAKCIQSSTCSCDGRQSPPLLSKYGCGKTHLVGDRYSGMVSAVNAKLNQIGTKGVDYEIAGFAWFQGWSDATKQPDWVEDECNSRRHRTSFWTRFVHLG